MSNNRAKEHHFRKKLLVFGATGSIGRELVKQALASEYEVTAFVRNPAKMEIAHSRFNVVQGDVLTPQAVEDAMINQDAILIALGAGKRITGRVRSEGTRIIIQAMQKAGKKRLICQTTLGVGDSRANLNFYWKRIMFGGLLRQVYLDHVLQEKIVKESDLDWTIVRPGSFTDGPRTGQYQHGFAANKKTTLKISRADVADFMLKQLTDHTYLHATPGLAY